MDIETAASTETTDAAHQFLSSFDHELTNADTRTAAVLAIRFSVLSTKLLPGSELQVACQAAQERASLRTTEADLDAVFAAEEARDAV